MTGLNPTAASGPAKGLLFMGWGNYIRQRLPMTVLIIWRSETSSCSGGWGQSCYRAWQRWYRGWYFSSPIMDEKFFF